MNTSSITIQAQEEPPQTFIEDVVDPILSGWSGLRHYIRQRKAGRPADPTMDTLLAELLRVNLGGRADIPRVVAHLTRPRTRTH